MTSSSNVGDKGVGWCQVIQEALSVVTHCYGTQNVAQPVPPDDD